MEEKDEGGLQSLLLLGFVLEMTHIWPKFGPDLAM